MKSAAAILGLLLIGAAPPPKSCLLLGAGVIRQIAQYKPTCDLVALDKRPSARIKDNTPSRHYDTVYVSAGGNDPLNPKLGPNLFALRRKLSATRVVWLAPYQTRAAQRVYETAVMFHDQVVYLGKFKENKGNPGHPKDYKAVAKALK